MDEIQNPQYHTPLRQYKQIDKAIEYSNKEYEDEHTIKQQLLSNRRDPRTIA